MSDAINGFSIRSTGSAKPKNKGRVHQAIKASPFTPLSKVGCASEEDETPARMLLNRIRACAIFSSCNNNKTVPSSSVAKLCCGDAVVHDQPRFVDASGEGLNAEIT